VVGVRRLPAEKEGAEIERRVLTANTCLSKAHEMGRICGDSY